MDIVSNYLKQEPSGDKLSSVTTSSVQTLSVQDRLKTLGINPNTGYVFSADSINSRFSANQTFIPGDSSVKNEFSKTSTGVQPPQTDISVDRSKTTPVQYSDSAYSQGYEQYQNGNQFKFYYGNQSHDVYGAYKVSSSSAVSPETMSKHSYNVSSTALNQNQSVILTSQSQENSALSNSMPNNASPSSTYKNYVEENVPSPRVGPSPVEEEEDDEAEILRAQLLKSVERRKKEKERLEVFIYMCSNSSRLDRYSGPCCSKHH